MNHIIEEKMSVFEKKRHRRKQYYSIFICLALIVAIGVSWRLKLTGISMAGDAMCGVQEHEHQEACYETVLICTLGKSVAVHEHSGACYQTENKLTCTSAEHTHGEGCFEEQKTMTCRQEEHQHSETCYNEAGEVICGSTEHTHSDGCYTVSKVCICTEAEHQHGESCYTPLQTLICTESTTPVEETAQSHEHTDLCYEKHMICEEEEHVHTLECYADVNADLENAAIWESTLPELTGIWHQDMVAVAQSQLGYTESERNYVVDETTGLKRGYSRYGAWYGNAYGDWCAMFVSFCLNYADISKNDIPYGAGCQAWMDKLKQNGQFEVGNYAPVAGDIIFFYTENGSKVGHVGIVEDVTYSGDTLTQIHTIEGNSANKVMRHTYAPTNSRIVGYGVLPENPIYLAMLAEQEAAQESGEVSGELAETPSVYAVDGAGDLATYVTEISGSGTVYDPSKDVYTTNLNLGFTDIPTSEIRANNYHYYYELPENIVIENGLLNGPANGWHEVYENGELGFRYKFIKNTAGTYEIEILFDQEYLNKGDTVDGSINFSADLDKDSVDENGNIREPFKGSQTDLELNIPAEDIEYPENTNFKYDIDVYKSKGVLIENGAKLQYEVEISTKKGTPSDVNLSDVLQISGVTAENPQIVSVTKYDTTNNTELGTIESSSFTANGTDFSASLPKLDANQKYKVVYTYDLSQMEKNTTYQANNTVTGTSTSPDNIRVTDSAGTKTDIAQNILAKSAKKSEDGSRIIWELKINESQFDISNKQVTDLMLAETIAGTLNVSPNTSYEVNYDTEGKITGITFTGSPNSNVYTITYETPVKAMMGNANEANISNTANFDGVQVSESIGVNSGSIEKQVLSRTEKDENGQTIIEWQAVIHIPEGGLVAGTIIKDQLHKESWEMKVDNHYFTKQQLEAYIQAFKDAGFVIRDGSIQPKRGYDSLQYGQLADNVHVTECTFVVDQAIEGPKDVTITYSSTTDNPNGMAINYENKLIVGNIESNVPKEVDDELVKKEVMGASHVTIDSKDRTVSWSVKIKKTADKTAYTVIDTLPEGMVLTKVSYGKGNTSAEIESSHNYYDVKSDTTFDTPVKNIESLTLDGDPTITTQDQKQVVTLTVNTGAFTEDVFYVTFTCKLTDSAYENLTQNNKTYKNTVSVKTADNIPYGGSTSDIYLKKEGEVVVPTQPAIKKSGSYNQLVNAFEYTININPEGSDLMPNKDKIAFSDELKYYVHENDENYECILDPSNVKLYYAMKDSNGQLVKDTSKGLNGEVLEWSYSESYYTSKEDWHNEFQYFRHYVLSGEIPDGCPLILQYRYKVKPIAGFPSAVGQTKWVSVNNAFKIFGEEESSSNISNGGNWVVQDTAGSITIGRAFRINKVDANNYRVKLSGAVFRIYKYDGTAFVKTDLSYTTNEEGYFEIRLKDENKKDLYDVNTLYYVVEEIAPEGYDMPENPRRYYFYFQNNNDTIAMPADFNLKDAVDLDKVDSTANITNSRDTKSITVNKVWKDESDQIIVPENPDAYAEVFLYRCEITKNQYDTLHETNDASSIDISNAVEYANHTLNTSNAWTYTWENLPVKKNAETYYYYYVTETPINGYETTIVRNPNQEVIEGDQITVTYSWTVTNKKAPEGAYNLPKTGSIGTIGGNIFGILLMMISLIFCVRLIRKTEKSNDKKIKNI